jgi:hypothetical protein
LFAALASHPPDVRGDRAFAGQAGDLVLAVQDLGGKLEEFFGDSAYECG